jgi:alkaline phosphatase D
MAAQSPDLVFHLGDYIYEKSRKSGVRPHDNEPELTTLADYRRRHSTYRSDRLLQQMHAACPWMVTWDDHEFDNNYAAGVSEEEGIDPAEFLIRRANAYQAYYEMMPLRRRSLPKGPDMRLYRRCGFGRLAEFLVLDTRQYRSDQPNGDTRSTLNDEAAAAGNTLLGAAQRGWLESRLIRSPAQWNVLAQQVMMGVVDRVAGAEEGFSMDQWPGYLAERSRLLEFCQDRRVANPVVLTGDIHSNWVNDLRSNDRDPEGRVIGTEFVGTSISSFGDGVDKPSNLDALLAENPGLRWHNAERGYVMCTVTPEQWQSDYWTMTSVTTPDGQAVLRKSFVVENGRPGAVEA